MRRYNKSRESSIPTDGRQVVSACHYPPVATSSLLTYEICEPLYPDIESQCGYLCAMGTHGDLGNTLKWKPPFPDMTEVFKAFSKKSINDAVSLINARKCPVIPSLQSD